VVVFFLTSFQFLCFPFAALEDELATKESHREFVHILHCSRSVVMCSIGKTQAIFRFSGQAKVFPAQVTPKNMRLMCLRFSCNPACLLLEFSPALLTKEACVSLMSHVIGCFSSFPFLKTCNVY
jgi:hypothetical protein